MTTTKTIKTDATGFAKHIFDQVCPYLDDVILRAYVADKPLNETPYPALCDFREDLHTIIYQHFGLSYGCERKNEQPINDIMGAFGEFIDDCREMGFDGLR